MAEWKLSKYAQIAIGESGLNLRAKMEYYQKAIDVLMEALKNPIHPYWKSVILSFIGDINRDYIKDKGDAVNAYKALIVVNGCDEKVKFVYQTMVQIQELGGSLDFMQDYREGKPAKLAKQYLFLVEPQKEQK